MSYRSAFWCKLENFTGNKYPKFIKEILNFCGYDNEHSIVLLNEGSIIEIEEKVNSNKWLLKHTVYERNDTFKFLIGHKALVLKLPETINKFTKTIIEEKKKQKESKENNLENSTDEDEFAKLLVDKINNFLKGRKLSIEAKIENIITISKSQKWAKVKCMYCEHSVKCSFDSVWRTSNLLRHLHTHFNTHSTESLADLVADSDQAPNSPLPIERARSTVLSEIKNVIRFVQTIIYS